MTLQRKQPYIAPRQTVVSLSAAARLLAGSTLHEELIDEEVDEGW